MSTCLRVARSRPLVAFLVAGVVTLLPCSARGQTIAAGTAHSVVVDADGLVWAWGTNTSGEVGDGTTTNRPSPTQVTALNGAGIVAVAAGGNHTLALSSDGTVWAWGYNGSGQLGDASTTTRTTPIHLVSLSSVVAIAAGTSHSVALRSDGTIYTWGLNGNGQLGNNSTTQATAPVLVDGGVLLGSAIGAGDTHTLAVKTDGTVWAWGSNNFGQLGDASTTQRLTPVQMSGVSNAAAVDGGTGFSILRLSDNTLKATGYNGQGQLGDGTTTPRTAPVAVSVLTSISKLIVGTSHTVAIKADGTLWRWGGNSSGQLGTGTLISTPTPGQVAGLGSISVAAAGGTHTVVAAGDGVVSVWGANSGRQLGDGTTVQRLLPVSISEANYTWKTATPTFSVASGTYAANQTVVVSVTTSGAAIHYTVDGAEPTTTDPQVTSGGSVVITQSTTLRARAFKTGKPASNIEAAVYVLQVATPAIAPAGGTFSSPRTVTITVPTSGATIRFTTDGTVPTAGSTIYTGAFTVGTTTTVKAAGFKDGWMTSATASTTYTMNFGTLSAPGFSPGAGTYEGTVAITLSSILGASIRYTTNGTTPSVSSPLYSTPVELTTPATVQARAFHVDYLPSPVASSAYDIRVVTPTFSITAGTYPVGQAVVITSPTPGTTLRYTLDGAEPTTTDTVVASGGALTLGNFTLKVKAWKTGLVPSSTASATYALAGALTTRQIAAGQAQTVAVRDDGTVWQWGTTLAGQWLLPRIAHALTGVQAVDTGNGHSVALMAGGSVRAWGQNSFGLGDGATTTSTLPVAVSGLTAVVAVSTSNVHTLALKSDGRVWAWGSNGSGQLGDGTTTTRTTPVQVQSLTDVIAIAAGWDHSYAVRSDGTVWAWGGNSAGQLGDGTTANRTSPVLVSGLTSVTAVAAGQGHGVALRTDGSVWTWGDNYVGQLGDGSGVSRLTPVQVLDLAGIVAVGAGQFHTLAVDSVGNVWAFGRNAEGQLGDGTTVNRLRPVGVVGVSAIVAVAGGGDYSVAVTSDGVVWTWGANFGGKLGDGTTTTRLVPVDISGPAMAWKVATPVMQLASGRYFVEQSVVVTCSDLAAVLRYTTDGSVPTESSPIVASGAAVSIVQSGTLRVRGWKAGVPPSAIASAAYELKATTPSISPPSGPQTAPLAVSITTTTTGAVLRYTLDGSQPTDISPTTSGTLELSETAALRVRAFRTGWTPSDSGGATYWINAGTAPAPTISPGAGTFAGPVLVTMATSLSGATIRYTLDGTTPTDSSTIYRFALRVSVSTLVKAQTFKAGYIRSAVTSTALTVTSGALAQPSVLPSGGRFATGLTALVTGAVGATLRYTVDGTDPVAASPEVPANGQIAITRSMLLKVRAFATGEEPSAVRRADFVITGAIAASWNSSAAIKADGTVWTWGGNGTGQLGDGTMTTRLTPTQVLSGASAIAAGTLHMVAAKADGTAWAWGSNGNGQLGDGTTVNHYSPVQVSGLVDVVAVAAGTTHSLALKRDGTVWAWGSNSAGELGDGTTISRSAPVQVPGLVGVSQIAVAGMSSFALQDDGGGTGFVWAWGKNNQGQLGDGTTTSRSGPVLVPGVLSARYISAGADSAGALLKNGTVLTWGGNSQGQLGVGTTVGASSAGVVPLMHHAQRITHGDNHVLLLDDRGRVWGWGRNQEEQLGRLVTDVDRPSLLPEPLVTLPRALLTAAGTTHSLVVAPDGQVWGVGGNGSGQLGDGTLVMAAAPVSASGLTLADNTWLIGDPDGDGLPTWQEYGLATDPLAFDTNGNGLSDGAELSSAFAPADQDSDLDGVANWVEVDQGTDPFRVDSDGDGANDLVDAWPLDATRSEPPTPNPNDHTPPEILLIEPVGAQPVP